MTTEFKIPMIGEKPVQFILSKRNSGGSMKKEEPNGERRPILYKNSKSIPAVCQILDPRENYKSLTWIRYMKGEKSVFVDEQSQEFNVNDYINNRYRLDKITFSHGVLTVKPSEPTLYQFLCLHAQNSNNHKKNGAKNTFFEYNPSALAKKRLDVERKNFEIQSSVFNLPFNQLKAVARVTGAVDTTGRLDNMDSDEIRHNLLSLSRRDPKLFEQVTKDTNLTVKFDIHDALDKGYIMWDSHDTMVLRFSNGNQILKSSMGEDKVTYAANFLSQKSPETLNSIRRLLGRAEIDFEQEVNTESVTIKDEYKKYADILVGGVRSEIIDAFFDYSNEMKGNENKLIWFDGAYGKWGDVNLFNDSIVKEKKMKGRDAVREFLTVDNFMFNQVREDFMKRIGLKN